MSELDYESDPERENIPPSLSSDPRSPNKSRNISGLSKDSISNSKLLLELSSLVQNLSQQDKTPKRPNLDPVSYEQCYENDGTENSSPSCIELALQGEKLCMHGDCVAGIEYFERAINVGTEDTTVLSAIYSQIGNAHFYLQDYKSALEYHKYDLELAKQPSINDLNKQATALGNLCNTFKCLNKFDQAINCGLYELKIGYKLDDESIVGRSLYNLGNVYHSKGKKIMSEQVGISCLLSSSYLKTENGHNTSTSMINDLTANFEKAISYYEENLNHSKKMFDTASEGRALGQLGNVNYRLGRWDKAVSYHEERLTIAEKLGDIAGSRRALANLANSHAGAGRIDLALEYYKKALQLSRKSKEPEAEAQACWSLAAAYNLIGDVDLAIQYQRNHLDIARALEDKLGEQKSWANLVPLYKKNGEDDLAALALKTAKEMSFDLSNSNYDFDFSGVHHSTGIFESSRNSEIQVNLEHSENTIQDDGAEVVASTGNKTPIQKDEILKVHDVGVEKDEKVIQPEATISTIPRSKPSKNSLSHIFSTMKRSVSTKSNQKVIKKEVSRAPTFKRYKYDGNGRPGDFLKILEQVQSDRINDQRITMKLRAPNLAAQNAVLSANKQSSTNMDADINTNSSKKKYCIDDIPVFLTKENKENSSLDGFLTSLAESASKRIESQRISTENLIPGIIREYIPPPDTIRRTFSENAVNQVDNENRSGHQDSPTAPEPAPRMARPVSTNFIPINRSGSISTETNGSFSSNRPRLEISRRASEMSDLDDNFLTALSNFQGRRFEDQRQILSPPKINKKDNGLVDEITPVPAPRSFSKFKIPQVLSPNLKMKTSKLNQSSSSSILIKKSKNHMVNKLSRSYSQYVSGRNQSTRVPPIPSSLLLKSGNSNNKRARTVPDEDMFDLLNKIQGHRIDDQRSGVLRKKK